jgi:hypothetical protein
MGLIADVWGMEHTPGGTAALAILDEEGTEWLNRLIGQFRESGMSPALERDAWLFLHAYRQLDRGILDAGQRAQLDWILNEYEEPDVPRSTPRPSPPSRSLPTWPGRRVLIGVAVILAVVLVAIILAMTRHTPTAPLGKSDGSGQSQPLQQPNVATPQVLMNQAYGPFNIVANDSDTPPFTGAPGVLYIDDSSADSGTASATWSVRFLAGPWERSNNPLIVNIQAASGQGQYFTFQTDPNSLIVFTVKASQPFFLMSMPQTLFVIDDHGTLWQIYSLGAQAKRLRIRYSS